jgi:3'-5' exoribonuclease
MGTKPEKGNTMHINEWKVGDAVEGFYILQSAYSRQGANGKPFLAVTLGDRSGTMEGKVWDYAGPVGPGDAGSVVWVHGTVTEFRGASQLTVGRIRTADASDRYAPGDLVPAAPIDLDAGWAELQKLLDSIADPDYAAICRALLAQYEARFRLIPAAKSVHHGFLGGLLMHTLSMVREADFLAAQYPDVIDRSLLLAGALLHDLAKCEEFTTSALGLVTDYSMKGQLLGHSVMGAQAVAAAAARLGTPEEKAALLQHLILSHHGEPDYGAALRPVCAEGELLSFIDLIDSRMEIYRETLQETPAGTFSPRVFALDRRVFHHN